jgi:Fe-S-cluster-containing dehydrogenase component
MPLFRSVSARRAFREIRLFSGASRPRHRMYQPFGPESQNIIDEKPIWQPLCNSIASPSVRSMITTLPQLDSPSVPSRPASVHPGDLISQLLQEQSTLTAVEQFSTWHQLHSEPEQAKYYRDLLPAAMPIGGQQLAFEVDLDRCSGCKACVVACHSLNGLDDEESFRDVGLLLGTAETSAAFQHVTTACHHCVDPGCLSACPVNAYEKDLITGIVHHLDDQCFGCQYCTLACPYEVPKIPRRQRHCSQVRHVQSAARSRRGSRVCAGLSASGHQYPNDRNRRRQNGGAVDDVSASFAKPANHDSNDSLCRKSRRRFWSSCWERMP